VRDPEVTKAGAARFETKRSGRRRITAACSPKTESARFVEDPSESGCGERRVEMHGLMSLDKLEIETSKDEVLTALRQNLKDHKEILVDARKAFVENAKKRLEFELGRLAKGSVKAVNVTLQTPADHSDEYETEIKMLEMHRGGTVKLSAVQVRYLVLNKWDWLQAFLVQNYSYSAKARDLAAYHGIDAEVELASIARAQWELENNR
jgi:hypothetical protein